LDFRGSFSRGSFSCVQVPRDLSGGLPERISGATLWVLDSIAEEFYGICNNKNNKGNGTKQQHGNGTKQQHHSAPHRVSRKRVKSLRPAAETVRSEGARGGGTRERAARTESTRTPQAGWHWGRGWRPRESNPGTSRNWTERQPRSRLIYLCPDTSPRGSCPSPARIRDLEHVLSCPVLVVVAQTANLGESRSRPSCTRRPRTYGSTRFPWLIVRVR